MIRTAAFALALGTVLLATDAEAQSTRCRVMDPTGTPLNVRDSPNGVVIGRIRNGTLVTRVRSSEDERGRPWSYVVDRSSGEPLGWVYREFIACF
ncbi:MAG: SH3 domain-containing protein [Xanthobacteraceae bacterium]|nr:MAG: SH3 domain-containing protein [Xanthobacteraceae bacterium]